MSEAAQTYYAISNQKTDIAGLPPNPKKRKPRTQERSAQEITGVGVNNKVEINPEMSKQLEGVIADMGGTLIEVVEVDEEKKPLPKLKMYRKAGNLARAGDEKSMKR